MKSLLYGFVGFFISYLFVAFVEADLYLTHWGWFARFWCLSWGIILAIFGVIKAET